MPLANNISQDDLLIKLLMLGWSKSGKTHWTLEAALAGFNLIFLDGDVAKQTIAKFPESARKRIYYIPVHDNLATARMGILVDKMVSSPKYLWNDTLSKTHNGADDLATSAVWEIMFGKLTARDIIVVDSLTALSLSCMRKILMDEGHDFNSFEELNARQKQQLYGGAGGLVTHILLCLKYAPCHVIVVGHPDEYEHRVKPDGVKVSEIKEKHLKITSTRQIPKSVSKPHGATLAKHFSSVLWIEPTGFKHQRMVDGRPDPSKDIGGQFTEKKDSKEYSFANLVKEIGGLIPNPDDYSGTPGIVMHDVGEYQPASLKPLDGQGKSKLAGSGLTGGLIPSKSVTKPLKLGKLK